MPDRFEGLHGISVVIGNFRGMNLVGELHSHYSKASSIGFQRGAKSWYPVPITAAGTGGNIATSYQVDDPVKPTTVLTPSLRAKRAVSFISSAGRCRTPSGSPLPQIREPTIT